MACVWLRVNNRENVFVGVGARGGYRHSAHRLYVYTFWRKVNERT